MELLHLLLLVSFTVNHCSGVDTLTEVADSLRSVKEDVAQILRSQKDFRHLQNLDQEMTRLLEMQEDVKRLFEGDRTHKMLMQLQEEVKNIHYLKEDINKVMETLKDFACPTVPPMHYLPSANFVPVDFMVPGTAFENGSVPRDDWSQFGKDHPIDSEGRPLMITTTTEIPPTTAMPLEPLSTTTTTTPPPIPDSFMEVNGRYFLIPKPGDPRWTWSESVDHCLSYPAKPFVPKTLEDWRWMQQIFVGLGGWEMWLPATDSKEEGELMWFDGTDSWDAMDGPLEWYNGRNLYNNRDNNDCVGMVQTSRNARDTGFMAPCNIKYHAMICEYAY